MKALVVRRISDRSIVAMGPDNGMYDPGYDPNTMTKGFEPDYETVLTEMQAAIPVKPDRRAAVLSNPAVPQWFKDYLA